MALNFPESKKILLRVDYNVPIQDGQILDFTRINASLPTIKYLLEKKSKIILMSHLGRPKHKEEKYSLKILIDPLEKLLNKEVVFFKNIQNTDQSAHNKLSNNQIGLLENLRFYSGETNNSIEFCRQLARYGDIYINDAFGASHRAHASTSGIHKFFKNKKYKGILLDTELNQLSKLKNNPVNPYTIIVGGSKIGSKIHLLKAFLNVADNIIIGGGMAFPFIKYLGGLIGKSLCEDEELEVVKSFLIKSKASKTKILLPLDSVITSSISKKSNIQITDIQNIPDSFMGVDIGPKSLNCFKEIINNSKLIMWNGPMGISEIEEFSNGTRLLAEIIKKRTLSGSYSLIGGGDTVSDITRFGHQQSFSYVSTGGGAMLDFFKNENLPGIIDLKPIK